MKTKLYDIEAIEYIAKLADGGLRDAVTSLDKCLSYSTELTLENVVKALGTVDYDVMKDLTIAIIHAESLHAVNIIEEIHSSGKDIKQFINQYVQFLLDIQKYALTKDFDFIQIPGTKENAKWLKSLQKADHDFCFDLLDSMVKLNSRIKWSQTPKSDVETEILLFIHYI